jgi:hypothetical protein
VGGWVGGWVVAVTLACCKRLQYVALQSREVHKGGQRLIKQVLKDPMLPTAVQLARRPSCPPASALLPLVELETVPHHVSEGICINA